MLSGKAFARVSSIVRVSTARRAGVAYRSFSTEEKEVTIRDALNSALDEELAHNEKVFLMGASSHPGAEVGPKGMAVRHLKWYASWV
eukprot:TRINITY_DN5605_c0_g1_i2.p1 TRINITY_DN5605_c0_g1~~TRINITY_DN5605_c0_g1_i2.p1  ORF type:complete len:87 (-),score=28.14 TRINITY_DN5605_c0_g1_i2:76-336(-)